MDMNPYESKTILLAEDNPTVCLMLKSVFQENGYTTLVAHSGEQALEIAREYPGEIHLLMTDVEMPRMNGFTLVERLAAIRPEIQVLYMSGYPYSMLEAPRGKLSRDYFLEKPFNLGILFEKVHGILDRPGA